MQTDTGPNPSPEFKSDPLTEAVAGLDVSRQAFFEAGLHFVKSPSGKNLSTMSESVAVTVESFKKILGVVMNDSELTQEARANILATFVKDEDTARVKFFKQHCSANFTETDSTREDMAKDFIEVLNDDDLDGDDVLEGTLRMYTGFLETDVNRLIEAASSTKTAKARKLAAAAIYHSRDVGKLTLGVAAGTWLANHFLH